MKKKQLYILPLIILLTGWFSSCSDDDNPYKYPEPDSQIYVYNKISINVSESELKLFEGTRITLNFSRPENLILSEKDSIEYLSYDSIVWSIPAIFHNISNEGSILTSIVLSFYLPGEYEVYIRGYKDNKVISADSATIRVRNGGDFLGLYWNNLQEYKPYNFIKHTSSGEPNFLMTWEVFTDPVVYSRLKYQTMDNYINEENWILFQKNSRKELFEYITTLYGECILNYESDDIAYSNLIEEYNQRFTIALDKIEDYSEYVPVTIWETPTTYISLLGSIKSGIETDINYYRIVAQPKDK